MQFNSNREHLDIFKILLFTYIFRDTCREDFGVIPSNFQGRERMLLVRQMGRSRRHHLPHRCGTI